MRYVTLPHRMSVQQESAKGTVPDYHPDALFAAHLYLFYIAKYL